MTKKQYLLSVLSKTNKDLLISAILLAVCVCSVVGSACFPSGNSVVAIVTIAVAVLYGLHQVKDMFMIFKTQQKIKFTLSEIDNQDFFQEEENE